MKSRWHLAIMKTTCHGTVTLDVLKYGKGNGYYGVEIDGTVTLDVLKSKKTLLKRLNDFYGTVTLDVLKYW